MNEDGAALEVGFAIDFHDSFGQLRSLDDIVGDVAANTFREFQRIEQASKGAISLGSATAQVSAFGNAASRELREVAKDSARVERAGEKIVAQMSRQIDVFGKNASEIRQMRAEMRAVEADSLGFTELAARIRAASTQLDVLEAGGGRMTRGFNRANHTMVQFGMQMNDVATMAALGAPPMQIFASQIGQIVQLAQQAEGGVRGFTAQLGGLLLRSAPLIAVLSGVAAGFALFARSVSDIDTKPMIDDLGLTRAEIKRLENTAVSSADVIKATFQVLAERVGINLAEMRQAFSDTADLMAKSGRETIANMYAAWAISKQLTGIITRGVIEGKGPTEIAKSVAENYKAAVGAANDALKDFGDDVDQQIRDNKLADLRRQANEIKLDRTAKADKEADSLARAAQATEAQIRNLYALAAAYRVGGAEALIAEARVKAESQAIKQRADITAAVERQIRLEIAQRVSDAAKGAASIREQAIAQAEVNGLVAAGIEPAQRAGELVQERLAQLPLLAALQVAAERGLLDEVRKVNQALDDQLKAQRELRDEQRRAGFNSAMATGNDRLAQLREELRLIGATDVERARSMAKLQAEQEVVRNGWAGDAARDFVQQQMDIAEEQVRLTQQQNDFNQELRFTADLFDVIHANASDAARGMADAFGSVGSAMGDALTVLTGYHAAEERLRLERDEQIERAGNTEAAKLRENRLYALRSASLQVGAFGDMAAAAQGFFKEGTDGYRALQTAEKAFRAVEFALSVRAIAQDAIETGAKIANSVARTAVGATEAVVNAIKSLPFPLNLAAGAATIAALASIGVAIGGAFSGGGNKPAPANEGRGTVLGDPEAQSQSLKRSIDALREVDLLTATYSREMLGSLRSIDKQIGGFASAIMRTGNVNADLGVQEGFTKDLTGKVLSGLITGGGLFTKIPIIGDILGGIGSLIGSLFGSKKEVVGSGLFANPQSMAQILSGGFDASYFSDIKKTKKFLGIKTGSSFSTQYTNANPELENQFTLILRSFSDAIAAAAGPLGVATSDIQRRLNSFVVNIGKIDTRNLTGTELQEKLTAVFGAAADRMASTVMPGIERFQQAGEGAFETLVRVASTVETVTGLFDLLGISTQALGLDAKLGVADQFDSLQDLSSATQAYFETFYTREEQAQAKLAQFNDAFDQMGIALPATLAGFRDLVEAQDLTTEAGRQTYAMLLQVAPAFADLQAALNGARSAADILAERQDLQRRLLQLQGNTGALRELELAQIDVSNRALQQQIWAIEDAQEAAKAAEQLRDAWTSVGDSIMDEVRRIRGLTGEENGGGFASLLGQFNAASLAARGGDIDAAKALPGLSQALLKAAELVATSRQELDRVRAQTAASLEATNAAIAQLATAAPANDAAVLAAAASTQAASTPQAANDDLAGELRALRDEVAQLRTENNAGHAATAGNTGSIKRTLDNVTQQSGGDAIATVAAA